MLNCFQYWMWLGVFIKVFFVLALLSGIHTVIRYL